MTRFTAPLAASTIVLAVAADAKAQTDWGDSDRRESAFIGAGLGPVVTLFQGEGKVGAAIAVRIGLEIGRSASVYLFGEASSANGGRRPARGDIVTAVGGLGVSVPVADRVLVSMGGGFATLDDSASGLDGNGFGVTLGVGYEVADRWILDLSSSYLAVDLEDDDAFNVVLRINFLSH